MSESKNSGDTTLTVAPTKTLSLKRPVEAGVVRQNFPHGRTKQVVVEKVKRRAIAQSEPSAREPQAPVAPAVVHAAATQPASVPATSASPVAVAAATSPSAPPSIAALSPVMKPAPPEVASPALKAEVPAPIPAVTVPAVPVQETPIAAAAPANVSAPAQKPAAVAPQRAAAAGQQGGGQKLSQRGAQSASPPRGSAGVVLRTLTDEEQKARARALSGAKEREDEDRRRAELDAKARAEREAREQAERAAAEERKREEDARRAIEAETRRKSEQEAKRRLAGGEPAPAPTGPAVARRPSPSHPVPSQAAAGQPIALRQADPQLLPAGFIPSARALTPDEDEAKRIIRRPGVAAKVVVPRPVKGAEQKSRGRLTVTSVTGDEEERTRSVAAFRRRTQRLKGHANEVKEKLLREVVLPETITIQELASRMSERGVDVIKLLMKQGQMAKITDVIDADTAELIAVELGHTVRRVAESDVEEGLFDVVDADDNLLPRPPVVTIMGHVDHGKTSLLDAIRNAHVVSGEAGGITQHIGAYQIVAPNGAPVTFIDTPGHAAFTAMRARGAKVTDIVVLVVAADDGVMPQTAEAIAHAKAAGVPIIVAINKIDKPDSKPERVRAELLQYEVQVETLGGETLEVEVSATKNINLDKLLDLIALQAELLDLKANPERAAEGTVIEARLDRGRGPVATVLVQRGTLHVGDVIVAGSQWGHVRALIGDQGETRQDAGPSLPVEVLGFSGSPEAGDRVAVVETESRAREITEYRERQKRDEAAVRGGLARGSLVDMMSQLKTAGRKEFPLVIKGDVQGSVEAIVATLENLNTEEVAARILHAGVGGVTESDVTLAAASNAVVIGFNVRAHKEARQLSEQDGVEIRYYNIIYNLVDDVKDAMSGLLAPTLREEMLGNAEILEVFNISKVGKVAGCRITDGRVERGAHVRLIRDNVVVHEGKLSTLKRFKDEVKDVVAGQECGMAFENYQDMRQGDVIECYNVHEIKRSL